MFQMPALLLSILLASLCATLFFACQGRNSRHLVQYWLAALAGFAAGQIMAIELNSPLPAIGQVHPFEGILVAMVALFVVRRLRL